MDGIRVVSPAISLTHENSVCLIRHSGLLHRHNKQPVILLATRLLAFFTAYKIFQERGSPELVAAMKGVAGHNIFYNYPTSYQGRRTIRYGLRLVF